jgi:hypothetical protein
MLRFLNGRLLGTCIEGAPPAEGAPAEKPWYEGAAAEDIGYLQNRGWDKVDAKTAAFNAAKAHREAEKLIGAPADKMVRLPADPNDVEGWRGVRLKLGMPQTEAGYADSLKVVKHADGSDLKPEEVTAWSKKAFTLGLRPADALTLVSESIKEADSAGAAGATEAAGKLAAEKTKLAENWGTNYEANMFVAKQAAGKLGVTPEEVAALEKVVGYSRVMEMFRNVGTKIGEDKFVQTHLPNGGNVPMTREAALDRKSALMADQVWVKAYLAGDATKAAEMTALNTMIVNQR